MEGTYLLAIPPDPLGEPMTFDCRAPRCTQAGAGPKFWAALAASLALAMLSPCHTTWVLAAEVPAEHAAQMSQSMELFKGSVREILSQHCVKCHGGAKTQGEFDLTTREGLLQGGEQGPAIVVGKPQESLLLQLVRHEAEPHMPAEAPQLPAESIEKLATWIALGAAYDRPLIDAAEALTKKVVSPADRAFWSFQPLSHPTVPVARDAAWCRTPLDHFVRQRQEAQALTPNPLADRRTLIRRAYFDLIGLPPTPAEVEAFLADTAADAYDRLIDRLLASPHYGERWGRHWLDLARFAESHGYEQDYDRPSAYHFRDFVIQALNADMPYDRFVRLQIAGDELEPDNRLALMATGFLGAGTHATQITASQVEKERYDELDDMASTVGTAMLGLTIGCARCHDHKYDPIPQADYYRLLSTFTTTVRSEIELDFHPEQTQAAQSAFEREHAPLVAALQQFEQTQLPSRFEAWLAGTPAPLAPTWQFVTATSTQSAGEASFRLLPDQSYLVSGKNAAHDVYKFKFSTRGEPITGIRLEAMADDSLPKHGPGRAANGNFSLTDLQVLAAPMDAESSAKTVKLVGPQADFEQAGLGIAGVIDEDKTSGWAIDPQFGKNHAASFGFESPVHHSPGTLLTVVLKFEGNTGHNLGRLRLAISTAAGPRSLDGPALAAEQVEQVNQALATPAGQRTAAQRDHLLQWYRGQDPQWLELRRAVDEHQQQAPKPALTKVMVTSEGLPAIRLHTQGGDFLEHTYYLKRGDLNQKLGVAEQSFLQVLMTSADGEKHWQSPPPPGWRTSYRRTALANWLTDVDAGAGSLLARVMANRLWQHHMGRGIVATPSDFGASGERPTHPELLDFLASQLVQGGWRLKDLHKLIMTSTVYMQTAETDGQRTAQDPDNLLLWHRQRQRLEGEVIRDAILSVTGQLDETMYGPGTLDESHRRRSIYFTIKRSQLVPTMVLFDGPDSLQGLGQRASTIVAPQALSMLNGPQVQSSARALAKRLLANPGTTAEQVVLAAYPIIVSRPADAAEQALGTKFLAESIARYQSAGAAEAMELAVADYCQALLGLNEFIYID